MMKLKMLFLLGILFASSSASAQFALFNVLSCDLENGKRFSMGIHANESDNPQDGTLHWRYGDEYRSIPVTQVYAGQAKLSGAYHIAFETQVDKQRVSVIVEPRTASHSQDNARYSVRLNGQEMLCQPNSAHFDWEMAQKYFAHLSEIPATR